jgi:hypothetical protein
MSASASAAAYEGDVVTRRAPCPGARVREAVTRYECLVFALAMCVGIEALIVLRDLRALPQSEAEEVSRWAARTLLRESLAETGASRPRSK